MSDDERSPRNFARLAFTETVRELQAAHGSREAYARVEADADRGYLGPAERLFIGARDSFYMATVGAGGWPYVQHRGGPPGFLRVVDGETLAFADFRGNRQYVSTGNVLDSGRAVLFLMDYPNRRRLKIWARARIVAPRDDARLATRVALTGYDAVVERIFELHVRGFDWNCTQHIVPRYTGDEIDASTRALRSRIAELEEECARLRRAAQGTGADDRRTTRGPDGP